jgi:hypothetical protein
MLIHLASALAIWAVDVSWMQAMGANRVLEVEFAHVCVDHNSSARMLPVTLPRQK